MPAGRRPRPSVARPVADAPVAALVAEADELAKDWLLALLEERPLTSAAELPVAELAREAPALCAAAARALGSDEALARLEPGGELAALAARAGRLAGATSGSRVADAIEALRRCLWRAALEELRRPDAALVADLADRLAAVGAVLASAALGEAGEPAAASPPPAGAGEPAPPEPSAPPPTEPPPLPPRRHRRPPPDLTRFAEMTRAAAESRAEPPAPAKNGTPAEEVEEHAPPPIVRPPFAGTGAPEGPRPRVLPGDPRSHLAACTADAMADGRPFAVLLVEVEGLSHLLAAQAAGEIAAELERVEHALEDLLRPGDAIRRETAGRLWLTLPGAGPAGARALAVRAAAAVERVASHRGVPLVAAVGLAAYPRDGTDPDRLADVAEDSLLAARAAGSRGAPPPSP